MSSADGGPRVVAIGGGHGLATTLRAVRDYAGDITAVVGDLRKCLVALAADRADGDEQPWARTFEHRFGAGELDGHALGNLVLVGLAEVTGDWESALGIAGRALGTVGRVLPATSGPVVIKATLDGGTVEGQVAVQNTHGRIHRIELVPPDAPSPRAVTAAIAAADQIVLAPGSLFTSLLPALAAADVHAALAATSAPVVAVLNLGPQPPETLGLDVADHVRAVLDAGIRVDRVVVDPRGRLPLVPEELARLGVECTMAEVARPDVAAHAPAKLACVLSALLQS